MSRVSLLSLGLCLVARIATGLTPPVFGGCNIFPSDSWWNTPIDNLPVHSMSSVWVNSIGTSAHLKADFGQGTYGGAVIGIPYVIVPSTQPVVQIHYTESGSESDTGPFPIPDTAPVEGAGASGYQDRHVLVIQQGNCMLYELYYSYKQSVGWNAGSGAKWNLSSNAFRTLGWTSADAAGLPIFPGLVKYEEVAAGEIRHAIRFTASSTRDVYDWPATHQASTDDDNALPPMGARFRLKASFDISSFPQPIQVILTAVKKYGLVLADNGSPWYMSGAPSESWDNDMLNSQIAQVLGSNMEAVDVSSLMVSANSGQVSSGGQNPSGNDAFNARLSVSAAFLVLLGGMSLIV